MCQPQKQIKTSQSPPSTQIQFHPTTPPKSTPNFSKPNNNHSPLSSTSDPKIWCRCGHGHCEVKKVHSEKNRGKKYLVCPIKRGVCCFEFKWCNNEHICESDLQPPLIKYPECKCGAGVCRKVMVNQFYNYYECPIKKSHGSCGYRVDEDELLHNTRIDKLVNTNTDELVNNATTDELVNNTSIVPIRQSRQRSLHEFLVDQNDITDDDLCTIDLGEGSDILLTTKRMKIIGDSENPSPVAVPTTPEGKCGVSTIEVANSQHDGFPEIEDDLESINLASWAVAEADAHFSTPPRTSCQQNLFQRDILANGFGIFPSFDPIVVPKQTSTLNSQSECNDLAIRSPHLCTQLFTDVVSPNRSPGSESERKAQQLQRDIAITTLQRLLNDLEGLDPHQHKSMRETAEATFLTLSLLKFECKQFSDYVWDFINLASSMAEIDKSMENSLTLEEHNKLLKEEQERLANIQNDCMKTEALLEVSNQKKNLLCEEVSCLEDMLLEKKSELKLCELETTKVEIKLDDLKRRKLEVDITLKDKARQAELAREKIVERDGKKIAARAALEKAKIALGN